MMEVADVEKMGRGRDRGRREWEVGREGEGGGERSAYFTDGGEFLVQVCDDLIMPAGIRGQGSERDYATDSIS